MLRRIDDFLNKITMYRLVLYCLVLLWLTGLFLSFFNTLPFSPVSLIISLLVILVFSIATNKIFERIFNVPSNTESTYITSFILALITGPEISAKGFLFLILISAIAIASKYILAVNKKHIFNPAALAIAAGPFLFHYYPSWWVGDPIMMAFVLITGFLIVRKIQRFDLVASFLIVFIATSLGAITSLQNVFALLPNLFAYSPVLFFAAIMLTEPATAPPSRIHRFAYGALVGFLIAPFFTLGNFSFSPEMALLAGNIFSYIVSPKVKLRLMLKEKLKIAVNTYDFVFSTEKRLKFLPGQYLEWTLTGRQKKQDSRGMRRYFTIASSPTENNLRIGIKFYQNPSSYKKALQDLKQGDLMVASQLAGDFTLPKDKNKKLVFLAGGIGITPFRSMLKYLIDSNENRNIVMFYANGNYSDVAYRNIFDQAQEKLGIKTVYVLADIQKCPSEFDCQKGLVTVEMIKKTVPDFKERLFYISGPRAMIVSFEKTLKELGIPKSHIKTDFFPGYA